METTNGNDEIVIDDTAWFKEMIIEHGILVAYINKDGMPVMEIGDEKYECK